MPIFSISQRLKIALGGFTSLIGFIIILCATLSATKSADLELIFQNALAIVIASVVGALNIGCGLLLILKNKRIKFSVASNQKKASNDSH